MDSRVCLTILQDSDRKQYDILLQVSIDLADTVLHDRTAGHKVCNSGLTTLRDSDRKQ